MIVNIQADLPRELEAVRYAAQRLGYNLREVADRTDKALRFLATYPTRGEMRQFLINMRGWDMPPQFATSAWLDGQLERLIDKLASTAEMAEMAGIASRG